MKKIIPAFIYTYIALPFVIFALGFVEFTLSNALFLGTVFSVIFAAFDSEGLNGIKFNKKDVPKIVIGLLFITLMVLLSGVGNVFWQNNDHATRNTIFDILVKYSWPPTEVINGEEVGLIYYIGFWLPSAFIGKLTSLEVGYIFSIIWAITGLFILWYLLCVIHKKIVIYPLIIFMFFSAPDILGHTLVNVFGENLSKLQVGQWAFSEGSILTRHLEWWARNFQYSSHTTQLFWVFNQCIPAWLATLLILIEKNNKNLVFIMGLTLLSSPFPFVGLIPIFLWCAFTNHEDAIFERKFTKDFKASFTSLFTFQNILGGGYSGILTFLYLKGNIASSAGAGQSSANNLVSAFSFGNFFVILLLWLLLYLGLNRGDSFKKVHIMYLLPSLPIAYLFAKLPRVKVSYYLLFIIIDLIIIALIAFPKFKSSSLYFIAFVSLLIIPFFTVGKSIDFCMRASIPALLVMCLLITESVKDFKLKGQTLPLVLSLIVLLSGAVTPLTEIARTIEGTAYELETKGKVENDSKEIISVFKGKNFTGKTKDNFFFEVLS
ncbi:MAG: hypothetical protein ACI3XA_03420 [Clostridia bacterium]